MKDCPVCFGSGKVFEAPPKPLPWRSRERCKERCDYMRELYQKVPPLSLLQIALAVQVSYGSEKGHPLDHSTILHHLRKRCRD